VTEFIKKALGIMKRHAPIIATIAASVLLWIVWGLSKAWWPVAIDWAVFHRTALLGPALAYQPDNLFPYPPTMLLLLQPLKFVGYWLGFALWTALSALAFYLAARRLCGPGVAAASLFSAACLHGLLMGQTPMLLGAAILAAFTMPAFGGGVILGAVAAAKPQLLFLLPLALIVRRDWPMLKGCLVGGAALVALSLLAFGFQPWISWVEYLPQFQGRLVDLGVAHAAITPTASAELWGLNPLPWFIAGVLISAIIVIKLAPAFEGANLVALVVGLSLIASPYALPHDLAPVIPALAASIISRPGWRSVPAALIFVGVLIPTMIILMALAAWLYRLGWKPLRSGSPRISCLSDHS
jgi:hypothetical protein